MEKAAERCGKMGRGDIISEISSSKMEFAIRRKLSLVLFHRFNM